MRKIILLPAFLFMILFACNSSSSSGQASNDNALAPGSGKLYLRTFWWAMNNTMEISWIYLGADGTIVKNPKHGNAPVHVAEEKKDNASYTGTYKVSGDQMTITWSTGQKETWLVQKKNNVFTALNKGAVTVANALPPGFRFDEGFSASIFFEGESIMHNIHFMKDGSCRFEKYSNADATVADGTKGTYTITKNTIEVQLGGKKAVANIGILPGTANTAQHLVINTSYQDL